MKLSSIALFVFTFLAIPSFGAGKLSPAQAAKVAQAKKIAQLEKEIFESKKSVRQTASSSLKSAR